MDFSKLKNLNRICYIGDNMDKIIIYTDGSSIGNGSVDSKCG